MLALLWTFRRVNAVRANRGFRWGQIASAATMAFGHGTQDAQKTMGVIALTLVRRRPQRQLEATSRPG